MRPAYISALILALSLCLTPAPADALKKKSRCQCMEAALKTRWTASQAVFTGTVTDIKEVKEWTQRGYEDTPVIVTMQIDENIKGVEAGKLFKLYTNINRFTCMGAKFEKDKKFLVFAYERKAEIYERWSLYDFDSGTFDVGGLCGGTKPMDDAATAPELAEIKALPKEDKMLVEQNGVFGLPPDKSLAQKKNEEH